MSYYIKTWAVQKGVEINNKNQTKENQLLKLFKLLFV